MEEIWKDIPGYEGLYQASSLGRIKSLSRNISVEAKNQHTKFVCDKSLKEKILKLKKTKDGYYEIGLFKNNKCKYFRVHRLIAKTFLDNPFCLPIINHKNHNRLDNKVDNLEWCTVKYNVRYSKAKKIMQLDKNKKVIKIWNCMSDVQEMLGIRVSKLSACCKYNNRTANGYYWRYYYEI